MYTEKFNSISSTGVVLVAKIAFISSKRYKVQLESCLQEVIGSKAFIQIGIVMDVEYSR